MTCTSELRKDGIVVIPRLRIAAAFRERFVGLMGRAPIGPDCGLLLTPCRSIHTFFMRFALDVVFLNVEGRVLRVARNVRPWRICDGGAQARTVLEMQAGWLGPEALREGDLVRVCLASRDGVERSS
jgi:uncharacterized protein